MSVRAATKRVLIVDDQPIVVGVLRAFFAQFQHGHRYELTTAHSANDAFILLLQEQFDLILLDIVLPVIDYWHVQQAAGLDLLKRVRDLGLTAPVLMMTGGDGGTPTEVEAFIEGAFGYLHKPFVWSELDHLVTLALGQRGAAMNGKGDRGMSEWHIVRPSPVHPWTVAIYENSRLIAEVSDDVATQIETLKREHTEAQVSAKANGATAAFWKARYDAVVAERAETQAAMRAIVEKHAIPIAQQRSSLSAAPFPRRLIRCSRRWLDRLRRVAIVARD